MLNFLRELVVLSSETQDLTGVMEVQKKVAERLKLMGAQIRWINSEKVGYASGLLAVWGPEVQDTGVCLLTHADTVYEEKNLQPYLLQGQQAFGGGVADNKGGTVVACDAIARLYAQGKLRDLKRPLYVFSSSCEELGSPAFQIFIKKFSHQLEYLLGMEPALPGGALIKKRRGNRYYVITAKGNSVHTGRDFVAAANPIEGVVQVYALIEKLRQQFPLVSISLNGIQSEPYKFNMSPEKIEMMLDVRFVDNTQVEMFHDELVQELRKITYHSPDQQQTGQIYFELIDDCPAFDGGSVGKDLQRLAELYSQYERETVTFGDGLGSSDCCYFYRPGLKIIDGLGPRGGKIHSPDEFIEAASLSARSQALAEYLDWLVNT